MHRPVKVRPGKRPHVVTVTRSDCPRAAWQSMCDATLRQRLVMIYRELRGEDFRLERYI